MRPELDFLEARNTLIWYTPLLCLESGGIAVFCQGFIIGSARPLHCLHISSVGTSLGEEGSDGKGNLKGADCAGHV